MTTTPRSFDPSTCKYMHIPAAGSNNNNNNERLFLTYVVDIFISYRYLCSLPILL